jgi:membrane protein implicated in regulation of membrane protease activity
MNSQTQIPGSILPAGWLGRVVATLVAASVAVVGLFFFAFALVAAAVLASIVALRIWWVSRKLRTPKDDGVIEGSYSVEPEQTLVIPAENGRSEVLPPAGK